MAHDGESGIAIADKLFAAIEAGDIDTVSALYSPEVRVWHNDSRREQTIKESLTALGALCQVLTGRRYDIVRRVVVEDGVLQQHILSGTLPDGTWVDLHAAMYLKIVDGKIERIEEYPDTRAAEPVRALVARYLTQSS